jgi:hypothetical protein
MSTDNTLLGRCTVALKDTLLDGVPPTVEQSSAARRATSAVLEHLSYELVSLAERRPGMTVHALALLLREEAKPG